MMGEMVALRLGKGWIHEDGFIYLYGSTLDAGRNDEHWSVVLRFAEGRWGYWTVDARLCGICGVQERNERVLLTMGIEGSVQVSDADGVHDTHVDRTVDGPNDLRHITALCPVRKDVYAIGMSRMVYRREPNSLAWTRIDDGMRLPTGTDQVAGLKALDGDGAGALLAAGLFGELWRYDGRRWRQLDSPTNMKLEAVRWVLPELVFVAGARGLLLCGPPEAPRVVEPSSTQDTFWSMQWFQNRLYLATGKGTLHVLVDGELVQLDPFPGSPITTGSLHVGAGLLMSVGSRDVLLFDGRDWRRLSPPAGWLDCPFDWTAD